MASIDALPLELLEDIAGNLSEPEDLAALTAINRRHYRLLNSILYSNHSGRALLWGAEHGIIGTARKAVEHGADVNFIGPDPITDAVLRKRIRDNADPPQSMKGWTALHVAAKNGHEEIVHYLVELGANLKAPSLNCCQCRPHMRKSSSAHRGDRRPEWLPLHMALCGGYMSIARYILDRQGDPYVAICEELRGNAQPTTALQNAAELGQLEMIEYLVKVHDVDVGIQDAELYTPLHYAATSPSGLPAIPLLLELGAKIDVPNSYFKSPLKTACSFGNFKNALLLIQAGASCTEVVGRKNLLHICAEAVLDDELGVDRAEWEDCRREVILTAVKHGADMDAISGLHVPESPLHVAASKGNVSVMKVLLEAGANVNARTARDQYTPLICALYPHNHDVGVAPAMVQLLLEHGADVSAADACAYQALHWACRPHINKNLQDEINIADQLLEHGADVNALPDGARETVLAACIGSMTPPGAWTGLPHNRPLAMLLLSRGARFNLTLDADKLATWKLFMVAWGEDDREGLELLLEGGGEFGEPMENLLWKALRKEYEHIPVMFLDMDVSVHGSDENGNTCLHYAAPRKDTALLRKLLDMGADPTAVNKKGETALDWALNFKYPDAANLLLDRLGSEEGGIEPRSTELPVRAMSL